MFLAECEVDPKLLPYLQSKVKTVIPNLNVVYKHFIERLAVCYEGEGVGNFQQINWFSWSRFRKQLMCLSERFVEDNVSHREVFAPWLSGGWALLLIRQDLDSMQEKFLEELGRLNTRLTDSCSESR